MRPGPRTSHERRARPQAGCRESVLQRGLRVGDGLGLRSGLFGATLLRLSAKRKHMPEDGGGHGDRDEHQRDRDDCVEAVEDYVAVLFTRHEGSEEADRRHERVDEDEAEGRICHLVCVLVEVLERVHKRPGDDQSDRHNCQQQCEDEQRDMHDLLLC